MEPFHCYNGGSTVYRARFVGPVPKPGEPLLFNRDPIIGNSFEVATVGGLQLPLSVSDQNSYLSPEDESELRNLLSGNASFKQLAEWAEEKRDKFIQGVIEAASMENKKYLIPRVFVPCDKALFVGIVAPNQPRKSAYAHMGLNHCDVIVGGLATEVSKDMKKGTELVVGNQKVGHILSGRCFVTKGMQETRLRSHIAI